jgi:hypoxanthine phosphoribosyltransferase
VSQYLKKPLEIIYLNLRNDENEKIRDEALLLKKVDFEFQNKKILLVDDVSRTSLSLEKAKELLNDAKYIKTLVFN